jgi:hypothetical protein
MGGIGYIVMVSRIAVGYSILQQNMYIEFVVFQLIVSFPGFLKCPLTSQMILYLRRREFPRSAACQQKNVQVL